MGAQEELERSRTLVRELKADPNWERRDLKSQTEHPDEGTVTNHSVKIPVSRRKWFWLVAVITVGLAAVCLLGALGVIPLGSFWSTHGKGWVKTFVTSPGFGGIAAVLGAGIAFASVRHQTRVKTWWERTEWALNLRLSKDVTDEARIASINVLTLMAASTLARREETRFMQSIANLTLDPRGDGTETDDFDVDGEDVPDPLDSFQGATDNK